MVIVACDPFGTSPGGGQVFATRPAGSGLRQLTGTDDLVVAPRSGGGHAARPLCLLGAPRLLMRAARTASGLL